MSHSNTTIEQRQPPSKPQITTPHTLHSNISYTLTNPHPRQVLDIYIPTQPATSSASASPTKPHPLILYVHGGAFKYGDKSTAQFLPHRQLAHNYAIAAINYRRSPEALFPAMIQDCKSALRFLKSPEISSQFNLDPHRVVVWGESAGGHAAAFCGMTSGSIGTNTNTTSDSGHDYEWDVGDYLTSSSSVQGVVDYYGPTDFLSMDTHLPPEWATHNGPESPESLYLGGQITREDMAGKVRAANPVTYIPELIEGSKSKSKEKILPQFFIAHGTEDCIVPEFMSTLLVRKLEETGVLEVEYFPVPGADHGYKGITAEQQQVLDERTDAFLRRVFGE